MVKGAKVEKRNKLHPSGALADGVSPESKSKKKRVVQDGADSDISEGPIPPGGPKLSNRSGKNA